MPATTLIQPDWLDRTRKDAADSFSSLGWPGRDLEDWRFTDLEPVTSAKFQTVAAPSSLEALSDLVAAQDAGADLLVFVNGRLSADYTRLGTLPDGVFLGSFTRWAQEHPEIAQPLLTPRAERAQALVDLNIGQFADGFVLSITMPGTVLPRPIHVIHWSDSAETTAIHSHGAILVADGAQAVIAEIRIGQGEYWTNTVDTVVLGAASRLSHALIQTEAAAASHTAAVNVTIGEGAMFDGFALNLGAALARRDYRVSLAGPETEFRLNGSFLLDARQESAIVTLVDHGACAARSGSTSRQVFKGALAGRSHGIFQGRITVEPDAQKTNAGMLSKTVLLSDRAVMDAKPELIIHADDVQCSHGASIGDLDETSLFYLRSRGIDPAAARRMLIEAFVADPIDLVEDAHLADVLRAALTARLATFGG